MARNGFFGIISPTNWNRITPMTMIFVLAILLMIVGLIIDLKMVYSAGMLIALIYVFYFIGYLISNR